MDKLTKGYQSEPAQTYLASLPVDALLFKSVEHYIGSPCTL